MSEIIVAEMKSQDTTIFLQTIEEEGPGFQDRGGHKKTTVIDPEQLINTVRGCSDVMLKSMQKTAIRSDHELHAITMELGFCASATGKFIVVNAQGSANFKLTLTWKR